MIKWGLKILTQHKARITTWGFMTNESGSKAPPALPPPYAPPAFIFNIWFNISILNRQSFLLLFVYKCFYMYNFCYYFFFCLSVSYSLSLCICMYIKNLNVYRFCRSVGGCQGFATTTDDDDCVEKGFRRFGPLGSSFRLCTRVCNLHWFLVCFSPLMDCSCTLSVYVIFVFSPRFFLFQYESSSLHFEFFEMRHDEKHKNVLSFLVSTLSTVSSHKFLCLLNVLFLFLSYCI